MSICTFEVCLKIPCGEDPYFSGTMQQIRSASQVSDFSMIWVFTVKNIRVYYRFCCFNTNKVSFCVIFKRDSCTTDLLVPYLDAG